MAKDERRAGIKHECELEPEENEFAVAHRVSSGDCVNLKRWFWSAILISHYNARSMSTYKSDYMIRRENVRKLQLKNYVIHPFSSLCTCWELWMCIIYSISLALPILYCFGYLMLYLRYSLSLFNVLDVLITFNIGYQQCNTGHVVCERRAIAKRYLCSWFILDIATLPSYCLREPRIVPRYLEYGQFLILFRIHTFVTYINNVRGYQKSYVYNSHFTRLLIPILVIFLWISEIYTVMYRDLLHGNNEENQNFVIYQTMVIISLAFTMGFDYHHRSTPTIVDSVTTVVGFCLEIIFMAFIFRVVQVHSYRMYKYLDIVEQMNRFATVRHLPKSIRKRMHQYMHYKYVHEKLQEGMVFNCLPKSLQNEVYTSLYSRQLEKSTIFREVPMEVVLKLTSHVTSALYMPTEVIINHGTEADMMYFIRSGMVAIYTQSGKEICHLNNGSSFGEMMVLENEFRNATVVAIDWCEMCVLTRTSLLIVFDDYPELLKKLRQDVHKRSANLGQPDAWSTQSNDSGTASLNSISTTRLQI